ncbi:hypothetical protein AKJ48_04250 [candidate division MSBL1 archaeon SCGC-AAA261O19]|uniref:Uncharacterized protein n=2 Tax=candidate division MSBL1 TaxID=215777 RepID=A0A133V006_9EURY|nr:hypothetical protein AKJ42_02540 [candidate division MSBL1 archaeon SCGC-AAA261C02]KXB03071.1 hypothetical protein AKJ48_04250 [candidate division MSBL1 archaeon SCGC-AAA261O19]
MVKMSVEIGKDVIDGLKRAISRYESYSFTKLGRMTTDDLVEALETIEPSEEREKELEKLVK